MAPTFVLRVEKKMAPEWVQTPQGCNTWGLGAQLPVVGAHHWVITMTRGQLEAR